MVPNTKSDKKNEQYIHLKLKMDSLKALDPDIRDSLSEKCKCVEVPATGEPDKSLFDVIGTVPNILKIQEKYKYFVIMIISLFDVLTDITLFFICFIFPEKVHPKEIRSIFCIFICFIICNIKSAYQCADHSMISKIFCLTGFGIILQWYNLNVDYSNTAQFNHICDLEFFYETIPSGGLYMTLAIWFLIEDSEPAEFEKIARTIPAIISFFSIAFSCQSHFTSHSNNLLARIMFGMYLVFDLVIRTFTFAIILKPLITCSNYPSNFRFVLALILMLFTNYTKVIYFQKFKNNSRDILFSAFLANFTNVGITSYVFKQDFYSCFNIFNLEWISQYIATTCAVVFCLIDQDDFLLGICFANIFILGLIFHLFSKSMDPIPWYVALEEQTIILAMGANEQKTEMKEAKVQDSLTTVLYE
jgi:hypothetical protein